MLNYQRVRTNKCHLAFDVWTPPTLLPLLDVSLYCYITTNRRNCQSNKNTFLGCWTFIAKLWNDWQSVSHTQLEHSDRLFFLYRRLHESDYVTIWRYFFTCLDSSDTPRIFCKPCLKIVSKVMNLQIELKNVSEELDMVKNEMEDTPQGLKILATTLLGAAFLELGGMVNTIL